MNTYSIQRQWVSACDLGTDQPWFPELLVIEADGWRATDKDWTDFYVDDEDGDPDEVVFRIRNDQVLSIRKGLPDGEDAQDAGD